jgi:AraC-like DNA-binding protein
MPHNAPTSSHWHPGYPITGRVETPNILVGGWQCSTGVLNEAEVAVHHEIWLQRQGARSLRIGDRRILADSRTAVFHNAREEFQAHAAVVQHQRSTVVLVGGDVVRALLEGRERFQRSAVPVTPAASLAHLRLLRRLGSGDASPLEIEERTLTLLGLLMQPGSGAVHPAERSGTGYRGRAQRELVEAACHVIALRFGEKLLLDDIARAVGSSPFHLSRLFRHQLGVPIHRYLLQIRLRAALDRMADSDDGLSRLALDVGFSSHSHFTTAFRREFGRAPGRLRRGL